MSKLSAAHPYPSSVNWQSEMTRIATKNNIIVCWVAIILNPIWFIADYFTISSHWKIFLVIRLIVAFCTALGLFFRKKINLNNQILIFIPVMGISLQNAYMWSVMDIHTLQKHAFAYIALFVGAGMLVLWKQWWSIAVIILSLVANIICFRLFSPLTVSEILINGGFLVGTVAVFSIVLIQSRYRLTKKEIISRLLLAESNNKLEEKNLIIEEKNKDITASINYAKRIQKALLHDVKEIQQKLSDSFILFKPKDIVSGDFYWFAHKEDTIYIAACDCTGHGVPGAFMSMIAHSFLNEVVNEKRISQPDLILNELRSKIINALKQKNGESKDGLDISLCTIKGNQLSYAGANNPLWIIRPVQADGKSMQDKTSNRFSKTGNDKFNFIELQPDKQPIGSYVDLHSFTLHTLELQKGDSIYLFSDGYADQFGGTKGKKFMYRNLGELLLSIQDKTMADQKIALNNKFEEWRGPLEQIDDVLLIGIRIT